jgi:hypothetical protein
MRPGPEVLASFGASADPVSLPGGRGTAWRAGEVVLKPAGDPRVARWTADLYRDLHSLHSLHSLGPVGHLDPGGLIDLLDPPPARGDPLFAAGEPPAVIDFSPYWRPVGLALAVAAVDALTWSGADPAILGELAGEPELNQLLARAHVGRLVTEIVSRRGDPDPSSGLDTVERTGEPVTSLILSRLAQGLP